MFCLILLVLFRLFSGLVGGLIHCVICLFSVFLVWLDGCYVLLFIVYALPELVWGVCLLQSGVLDCNLFVWWLIVVLMLFGLSLLTGWCYCLLFYCGFRCCWILRVLLIDVFGVWFSCYVVVWVCVFWCFSLVYGCICWVRIGVSGWVVRCGFNTLRLLFGYVLDVSFGVGVYLMIVLFCDFGFAILVDLVYL